MTASLSNLKSFIPVDHHSHFPIQNLPWGVFRTQHSSWRLGMALGKGVIDLDGLVHNGLLKTPYGPDVFKCDALNHVAEKGPTFRQNIRESVQRLLREDNPTLRDQPGIIEKIWIPMDKVLLNLPFKSSGYTDFYSSIHHATNVGKLFRDKEQPLLPNWKHLPVAYNGRASTLVPSGTKIFRPSGQVSPGPGLPPQFQPTAKLDYELELGYYIGQENNWGEPISVQKAEESIFGFVLVNDWSARDIQAWEYVPLGPFLGKSFATSVSPWVVTPEALAPFRIKMEEQDPTPLPYLFETNRSCFDIDLEIWLAGSGNLEPERIAHTNAKELYWSYSQQIAHHTINGCQLKVGDLLATGTISGKTPASVGSLLEATLNGTCPIRLSQGQERRFLQDHDTVILKAFAQGQGFRIGFGEVSGEILPARKF